MDEATRAGSASQPAGGGPPALTLRAEHDLPLREITARAEGVLSAADAGRWPRQQLAPSGHGRSGWVWLQLPLPGARASSRRPGRSVGSRRVSSRQTG
jgi:hypothetical protein